MKASERRVAIKRDLNKSNLPIKGMEIANKYGVSRQVIVQDIAILKAEGTEIIATPNGYMILKKDSSKLIKSIPVKHYRDRMGEELYIMVDNNAKVLDVMVEHPVYGEIKGNLNLNSRDDVDKFIEKIEEDSEPLSSLTDGVHIHSLEFSDDSDYEKVLEKLKEAGFLLD